MQIYFFPLFAIQPLQRYSSQLKLNFFKIFLFTLSSFDKVKINKKFSHSEKFEKLLFNHKFQL
jgi:hypothetical protein